MDRPVQSRSRTISAAPTAPSRSATTPTCRHIVVFMRSNRRRSSAPYARCSAAVYARSRSISCCHTPNRIPPNNRCSVPSATGNFRRSAVCKATWGSIIQVNWIKICFSIITGFPIHAASINHHHHLFWKHQLSFMLSSLAQLQAKIKEMGFIVTSVTSWHYVIPWQHFTNTKTIIFLPLKSQIHSLWEYWSEFNSKHSKSYNANRD